MVLTLDGPLRLPGPLVWRLAFGFGAALALAASLLRWAHLRETPDWRRAEPRTPQLRTQPPPHGGAEAPAGGCAQDGAGDKAAALGAMSRALVGTAGAWFLYDVVTYGVGLFTTTIFPAGAGLASARTVLLINLITLPGYALAVTLSSRVRLRQLQLGGLCGMSLLFLFLGALYEDRLVGARWCLCLVIFSLQRCLDAMGPGLATFAIPGQIYPTRVRASAHGLSAASGKLGAVAGTVVFPQLLAAAGMKAVMCFMSTASLLTFLWTLAFVPSYGVAELEEIARHDQVPLARQAGRPPTAAPVSYCCW